MLFPIYNMIIMDPPSYGRGANGEVWSLEKNLSELISLCSELLVDLDSHLLVNSYSGLSHEVISNVIKVNICNKFGGEVSSFEIGLKCSSNDLLLPCGICCRWER